MNTIFDRSRIGLVGACTIDGAYGLGSGMPWPRGSKGLPGDMSRFVEITSGVPQENLVNLLIAGKVTAETMSKVDLRPNRLLVSVSMHHPEEMLATPENISRHDRILFVRSPEDALTLLHSPIVNKVFFIGGKAIWKFGFTVAGKAYLTIALKECPGDEYSRLAIPLHIQAELAGFVVEKKIPTVTAAWSPVVDFLDCVRN